MQELQLLKDKLDLLLKKYTAMQTENKRLKEANDSYFKQVNQLNEQLHKMEESLANVQMNQVVVDNGDKDTLRKQLDIVIGEIDKILTKINE
jgi:archaellum component FlaF (FlaF/FlaG flagellin family)